MPIEFYGATQAANEVWNNTETINGQKTFSDTIIGDISSNGTSYFTDICANRIYSNPDAGQALIIDSSLIIPDACFNILSNGNVGIGITAPEDKLHIKGGNLIIENPGHNNMDNKIVFMEDHDDNQNFFIGTDLADVNSDDQRMFFGYKNGAGPEAADSLMVLRGDGNVGIGTTAPLTSLSITPADVGAKVTLWDGGGSTDHYGFGISSNQLNYDVQSSSARHCFFAGGKNGSGTELMRIQGNGNVGIGITSPDFPLDIQQANYKGIRVVCGHTNTEFLRFAHDNTSVNGGALRYFGSGSGNANAFRITMDNTNTGNPIDALNILQDGNVGIGTTNPDQKLQVNGLIKVFSNTTYNSPINNTTNYPPMGILFSSSAYQWCFNPNDGSDYTFDIYFRANTSSNWTRSGYFVTNTSAGQIDFTGQHRSILNKNVDETSKGLIVSSSGKYINLNNSLNTNINESLPICNITNTDNDKKVFGVISDKENTNNERTYSHGAFVTPYEKTNKNEQRMFINSLGEGAIWVCNKNGSLSNGEYISSSSVAGYGMKQTLNEDFLTRYTVAKITCDCHFSLTKIVKQKLKVINQSDSSGNAYTDIDYDTNGDVQYEDDLDANGAQQMIFPFETRFLQADATQITEAEYNSKLGASEEVYIACFVGCTYHCG